MSVVAICYTAEYHQRDPSESPFEEGDIVAFGAHGLTRKTTAARQLGVISRRAIVKGSRPADPAAMSDFDAVAYMGIVPVKLRGPAYRDDYVVPSGKVCVRNHGITEHSHLWTVNTHVRI
eukprot:COSAG02_NODE_4286_length_5546_cov_8.070314_4_plen_120_part_00